jgi:hypothetical protein
LVPPCHFLFKAIFKFAGSLLEELKHAITQRRRQKMKKDKGEVKIIALYRVKDKGIAIHAKPNFEMITETAQIKSDDILYISVSPDPDLKYQRIKGGRNHKRENEELKEQLAKLQEAQKTIEAKLSGMEKEWKKSANLISDMTSQLKEANEELQELRPLKEKLQISGRSTADKLKTLIAQLEGIPKSKTEKADQALDQIKSSLVGL